MSRGAGRRLAFLAASAVVGSYLVVRSGRLETWETGVAELPRRGGAVVDRAMAHLTDLGSVYGLLGAAAALALTGRRDLARDLAGAGTVAWVAGQSAKPILDRPRPYQSGSSIRTVATPAGSSWPSGHSAVAAAMGAVLAEDSLRGALVGLPLAVFVGGSRLHVGVHHPTDVVGGWGVGVLSAGIWRGGVAAWRVRAGSADAEGQ